MPYLEGSTYTPPSWLSGAHAQTLFPALLRRVRTLPFERRRIGTPDGDFVDLDLLMAGGPGAKPGSGRGAVVLSHGLEGDSRRKYIRGMCLALAGAGWDCVARNLRACGGEMNRSPGMYHSGQTEDLRTVVLWCLENGWRRVLLVGFSLGGNQVLKYLGENPDEVPDEVVGAAAFSVPCDLTGCSVRLDLPENSLYMLNFMYTLKVKVRRKHEIFPDLYPLDGLEDIRTFREFDGRYTAPLHGFDSAEDYWRRASSLPFLADIRVKTLLVNARNDPFLSFSCYPEELARNSPWLTLETPGEGGHVGFVPPLRSPLYWSEGRVREFFAGELEGGAPEA